MKKGLSSHFTVFVILPIFVMNPKIKSSDNKSCYGQEVHPDKRKMDQSIHKFTLQTTVLNSNSSQSFLLSSLESSVSSESFFSGASIESLEDSEEASSDAVSSVEPSKSEKVSTSVS